MTKSFVVGFLFNGAGEVCLIEKQRPLWQKGRLNGIGGQIEDGESPHEAMNREFLEESGAAAEWREFCYMHGSTYNLYCFTSGNYTGRPRTLTDEKIAWYRVDNLPDNIVTNLTWLVPIANYGQVIRADVEHESETA